MEFSTGIYTCRYRSGRIVRMALTAFALLVLVPGLYAQQPTVISQYMFNNMQYNPAYAGNSGGIAATGLLREQYMGYSDNAGNKLGLQTIFLTVDAPIRKIHGGVGGSIVSDQVGFFNNIAVNLGYAFRADLGEGTFAVGAQLQLDNIKLDYSKWKDHIVEEGDPLILEGDQSDLIVDAGLGLYYEVPEKYYVGLSANHIAESKGKITSYPNRRTYTLTGGYNFVMPNRPLWEIKPTAIVQYDGGTFQWNLSALVTYKKKYWGGLGYRYQDAAILLAGANIKNLRIGLAYDISTSALTSYNSGSIEVMISYCFKMELEKYRKRYKNTRFL